MRPGAALVLLAVGEAWADHGSGGTRAAGSGWALSWLFVVAFLVVVALAGWALFAPAADEPDDEDGAGRPSA